MPQMRHKKEVLVRKEVWDMRICARRRAQALCIAAFAALLAFHARGTTNSLASTSVVSVEGAVVGDANGKTYYKFDTNGVFQVNGAVKARVLAVGGGGAGATPGAASSTRGGAGGGGAGGMIDDIFYFKAGSYLVVAGAGGDVPADKTVTTFGESGKPSYILCDGVTTNLFAHGGGGGGAPASQTQYAGQNGGSGGGGSRYSAKYVLDPGEGVEGQGNAGGACTANQTGGGGGGAGGPGGASSADKGGAGGAPRPSDITGPELFYAAGGGGGTRADSTSEQTGGQGGAGSDGKIIGGNGAGGTKAEPKSAEQGKAGTGSGGGGGRYLECGGAGGSGVVIIRIEAVHDGVFEKPAADLGAIPFDGVKEYCPYADCDENFLDVTGTLKAYAVGEYEFTVTPKTGIVWSDGTSDSVTCSWRVTRQQLQVSGLRISGWQQGEVPNVPVVSSTPTLDPSWYGCEIRPKGSSAWLAWEAGTPLGTGDYELRIIVYENENYSLGDEWTPYGAGYVSAAAVASFSVWNYEDLGFPDYLGYHTVYTVTEDPGETLTNFPMLVRIDEAGQPGIYRNTRGDRSDIRFTLPEDPDTPLAYEIDTWDPSGESLVWVKMPEYKAGAQVVMSWGEIVTLDEESGEEIPVPIPDNPADSVWSEYVGVWHFAEEIAADAAATAVSPDATGNGHDATPVSNNAANGARMVSTNGVFGCGRVNATASGQINRFELANTSALTLGSKFTVSGWMDVAAINGSNGIISRKSAMNATDGGWEIAIWGVTAPRNIALFGGGSGAVGQQISSIDTRTRGYIHVLVAFDGASATIYGDGDAFKGTQTLKTAVTDSAMAISIGGNTSSSQVKFVGAFDEWRIRIGGVSAAWAKAEYAQAAGANVASGLYITRKAKFLNRWLAESSASPTTIKTGESIEVTVGEAAYGSTNVVWRFRTLDGIDMGVDAKALPAGTYLLTFTVDESGDGDHGTRTWTGLEQTVTITVNQFLPVYSMGDAASVTRLGRILLANDDANEIQPVEGQAYYRSKENVSGDDATYWVHENEVSVANVFLHLFAGTTNVLESASPVAELCGSREIWYLDNVRIGNIYQYVSGVRLENPAKNGLPQAATAKAVSAEDGATGSIDESAHLVMRNLEDAAIYSACYRDGIGSLYFDAVNGWTNHVAGGVESYCLAVEVCVENKIGQAPYDENVHGYEAVIDAEGNDTGAVSTNRFAALDDSCWRRVKMTAIKIVDGVAAETVDTEELALDIENGGGTNSFYRVIVDKDALGIREPARFRIRRTSAPPTKGSGGFALDEGGFILIDNIQVTPPPMRVDLKPLGNFDAAKGGRQTTGWSGAFEPAFPSVASRAIYARMEGEFYTNSLQQVTDGGSNMVVSATMFYRWRNLSHAFDPAGENEWKSVPLARNAGFRSTAPLDVPRRSGDIEFWTEVVQAAPFYVYCDYSGLDIGTPGYTEEVKAVTNRCGNASVFGKTLGTDWFVRLRDGSSAWEKFAVTIVDGNGATNTHYATLADEATWRCYLKTPTNETGTVKFRLEGVNRQTDGSRQWATNTVLFAVEAVATDGEGGQGVLTATYGERDEFGENDWCEIPIDAKTGYLLFQAEESGRSITVVHADYQNFNEWTDAVSASGTFVGAFNELDGGPAIGTSGAKQTFASDFASEWNAMPAGSAYWKESFSTTTEVSTNFFKTATTLNGWTANYAKYIYEKYDDPASKAYALQMRGDGLGSIEYVTSGATQPRGIDTLSFTARQANSIEWDDICYSDEDGMTALKNYTFVSGVSAITNGTLEGAYSVSLVANYRPTKGCYELRYVQRQANVGYLQLWKWAKSGSKMKSFFLGSAHWSGISANSGLTGSATEWAKLAISVTNLTETSVKVVGAIKTSKTATYGGDAESGSDVTCNWVEFTDTGASAGGAALTKGTAGVISANCPALFYRPRYYTHPLTRSGGSSGGVDGGSLSGMAAYSSTTAKFPSSAYGPNYALNGLISDDAGMPCDYEEWAIAPGRMMAEILGPSKRNALRAIAPAQTLGVFLGQAGSTAFDDEPVATMEVASFLTQPHAVQLRKTDDCSVQIRVIEEDNPAEVVIDNIELTQWRGADWSELGREVVTNKPTRDVSRYAYTNFTFTSAWVQDWDDGGDTPGRTVLLSARRTSTDGVASIVSPLMDGWEYSDGYRAGKGIGQISFRFHGAQANARLCVQVLTNATNITQGDAYSYAWTKAGDWQTVETLTFTNGESGVRSCYFGYHGVHGLVRISVDDALVAEVADSTDEKAFGDIYIDSVTVRDEPEIDYRSWWGWNVRTLGDPEDSEKRMLLSDISEPLAPGLALALNNSVSADIDGDEYDEYTRHLPFVQTPTFGTNIVGGVTFKARKYNAADERPAYVALYGSQDGEDKGKWIWLKDFAVTTNLYENFSYTTSASETYRAFRLVVRGVEGVEEASEYDDSAAGDSQKWDGEAPMRVLLDEVSVTEAIRPRVGFRGVGAFRSDMNGIYEVPNVPSEAEQPLCKEGWGVQCEIYKAQLPDKIDFASESNPPKVILHWYSGEDVWGFNNWRTNSAAHSVELMRAEIPEDSEVTNFVFRSSYQKGSDTIVPESRTPGTVVQYMLEVRYNQYNDAGESIPSTNFLTSADWNTPEWYRPLDYNRDKGGESGADFSAYTILDTVAPHWAWINEVNILGAMDGYDNTDAKCQYVEIAAPAGADLTGWQLQMLAVSGEEVVTNVAAVFGTNGLSGVKDRYVNTKYGMTFRVIGSPYSQDSAGGLLKYTDGTLDGVWTFDGSTVVYARGEISPFYPIAVQLVRPKGILESEVVAIGTNYFAQFDTEYAKAFYPEVMATNLNHLIGDAEFLYIGTDDNTLNGIITNSLSVVTNVGGSYACWTNGTFSCWTNGVGRTPGRLNIGQTIEGTPPSPGGMSRLIFSTLTGGRIEQWDPEGEPDEAGELWTANDITMYVQRSVGTNIVYRVPKWHVVRGVTWAETGSSVTNTTYASKIYGGSGNEWRVNVGTNVEGSVTVTAHAELDDRVAALIGSGNRYREAIVDWLANSENAYGDAWDESDELYMAEFHSLGGTYTGPLTLTQMYWLDIPPTTSNMWLVGGISDVSPIVRIRKKTGEELENTLLTVKMYITNANENSSYSVGGKKAWAPYILQGMQPDIDGTSWGYVDGGMKSAWTNATFKIQGKLMSLMGTDPRSYWLALRKFVFYRGSFDDDFQAVVEVLDCKAPESSPAYEQWRNWLIENPSDHPFYYWTINDATDVTGPQLLFKTNTFEEVLY